MIFPYVRLWRILVNINVLSSIKKDYDVFRSVYNKNRKDISIRDSENTIKDLFLIEIFSCFERFLRDKYLECLNLDEYIYSKDTILKNIEYIKIDEILESLKKRIDSNIIGNLKQIKKYRDWVAHGRNMKKPPPINKVDIDKTYEMVKDVMEAINYDTK